MSFEELRAGVLALPEEQRMEIVELLMETLPEEEGPPGGLSMDDPGFLAELDRRAADPKDENWKTWEEIRDEP